ncbi:MAG: LytTR family DNA-binding domain-containing protein [Saprospiraceae bacterium]|nr:LytTR family DNA-binding domain-containing protein [Saprospiraceae bacterium]
MKALIVEDSRLARLELKSMLKAHPKIELLGEAANVDTAFEMIQQQKPDLLFLDINMPEKNGFDLLEMLEDVPIVIFTTAYDQYAIKAFEYNTLDYLLKPISKDRLAKAIQKAEEQFQENTVEATPVSSLSHNSQIFVKDGEHCWLVYLHQVLYFESVGNYTRVFFDKQQPLIHKSLNKIAERLEPSQFFRANRQFIINLKHIQNISTWFSGNLKVIMANGTEIEISRRQASKFKQLLSL